MLRVITTNIRFDNPKDGSNTWGRRKNLLQKVILSRSPHLVCSQEGREPQLRVLEDGLEMRLVDSNRKWITERMYPCIFVDERIVELESGDLWLSKTPYKSASKIEESAFPRLCTWLLAEFKKNKFMILNLHLDHTTEEVRQKQCDILIQLVKTKGWLNYPLILVGDFNTRADSEIYKSLCSQLSLKDSLESHEMGTFHGFQGKELRGERIDWILYSQHFSVKDSSILTDHHGACYPSDHYPVYAELVVQT